MLSVARAPNVQLSSGPVPSGPVRALPDVLLTYMLPIEKKNESLWGGLGIGSLCFSKRAGVRGGAGEPI